MPDIVLTTLNAKYAHCAFGLRYLMANLGELKPRARILEFDINQRPVDAAEAILRQEPKIVGVGVYIWNAAQSLQLVSDLKRLRPELTVIIGGPEVSYEIDQQEIGELADYVITGEGDLAFAQTCRKLLNGGDVSTFCHSEPVEESRRLSPTTETLRHAQGDSQGNGRPRIIPAPLPEFSQLTLPYDLYTDEDIAHRVIYVEASRGCPFECEFCLSSLDVPVRNAPLDAFLAAMQSLLDRGVRQFKFVDRTFNLNIKIGLAILDFFVRNYRSGQFVHFEMIPDRLPEPLREVIRKFPPGALQFEVGIQTFNENVAKLISRRQDNAKVEENLRWLRAETGVHVHADLIVGLPGEDLEGFSKGFDRLVALRPQEIQVGLLKRLRGTAIVRHDQEWGMIYSPHAPYEILQTKLIDFFTMQRLRRFARYWDLVANSGNFIETTPLIWRDGSPFRSFMELSDWLYARTRQTHAIALPRLRELLKEVLLERNADATEEIEQAMSRDSNRQRRAAAPQDVPRRQARHLV